MSPSRSSAATPLTLVGPGKVGKALARALHRSGWPVHTVAARRAGAARSLARSLEASVQSTSDLRQAARDAHLLLLAVPEGELHEVAETLAGKAGRFDGRGRTFLHTSGGAPVDALEPLRATGAATGRFHPLYPFTGRRGEAASLEGVHFGIDGDRPAVAAAKRLARHLGGRVVELPPGGAAAYHLSAVITANLTIALAAAAATLGKEWGKDRSEALRALLPLLAASVDQLRAQGLPAALTGPLVRGEAGVLTSHLELLRKLQPQELAEIYRLLSRLGVELAVEAGHLPPQASRQLKRALGAVAGSKKKR